MKTLQSLGLSVMMSIAVSACTGVPIKEATDELIKKPVCCTSFSELTFEPLRPAQRQIFDLNKTSPVMEFSKGRSYFHAFSLPPNTQWLTVHSINTEFLPKTSYVDPVIVVLNLDKKPIAHFSNLDLRKESQRYLAAFLEWYFGDRISLPPDSAFVVVYANNGRPRILQTYSANGTLWPVRPSPIGKLALIAE